MTIGREDAFSLFRKWLEERTFVRCTATFDFVACRSRGRIIALSDSRVKFASDDNLTEFDFLIPDDCRFGYGDSRDFPHEQARGYDAAVAILFPPDDTDTIAFESMVESPEP